MNDESTRSHWQRVYTEKSPTAVSWYQNVPAKSLALIERARAPQPQTTDAQPAITFRVIDIGGGASTLVDHLLMKESGCTEVCIVDIAPQALNLAKERLGQTESTRVRWLEADATGPMPQITDGWADIWHDRAVFQFLTTQEARLSYARNLARILRPGGTAIVAAFATDGPEKCSGLPVRRHNGHSLLTEMNRSGRVFTIIDEHRELHTTPWGSTQAFVYAVLRG